MIFCTFASRPTDLPLTKRQQFYRKLACLAIYDHACANKSRKFKRKSFKVLRKSYTVKLNTKRAKLTVKNGNEKSASFAITKDLRSCDLISRKGTQFPLTSHIHNFHPYNYIYIIIYYFYIRFKFLPERNPSAVHVSLGLN